MLRSYMVLGFNERCTSRVNPQGSTLHATYELNVTVGRDII